ncbi:MAG: tetratricopeptide repeat protein, partial [Chloroflexi bacterium]|nr:tetratricopeptide repeat protein [Chloroflexota bacterium]
ALAADDRALQLRPDDPESLMGRGVALGDMGRYQEALQTYERALQLRPDNPGTLYNRACLYSLWSKPDEALEDLRRAIGADPEYRDKARTDSDFDNIRDDPRFRELVGEDEPPAEGGANS